VILGDISSLRENWNGAASFVPLDDPAELIDVIENLISNRARREELGREARTRAMEFSRSRMLDGYFDGLLAAIGSSIPDVRWCLSLN
jgi:glycogen synthase